MFIETDIIETELHHAPAVLQDKTRVVLRTLFLEAYDLKEAESILNIVDKVVKRAAKKIDTKEFKKKN